MRLPLRSLHLNDINHKISPTKVSPVPPLNLSGKYDP